MKRLGLLVVLFFLFLSLAPPAAAQGSRELTIAGTVRIGAGRQPDGRVQVSLYTTLNAFLDQTYTDSSGSFTFSRVRPGNYRVVARLDGFQEGSTEVTVFSRAERTNIPPILLQPLSGGPQPSEDVVDAAELRLGKEGRKHYRKALRAFDEGRLDEAHGHLERTIELEPAFAGAHHFLGATESMLGNYARAETSFQRAIELNPRRAESYFGLGRSLNLLQRPAEALPAIEKGLELHPRSGFGLFEKGRAQFLLGDFVASERTARESLTLTAPPPEIHLILANCYINLRRYPEAAQALETYLNLDPKSTSAPQARKTLAKLKSAKLEPPAQ